MADSGLLLNANAGYDGAQQGSHVMARLSALSAAKRESMNVTLVTQEGDRVQLSTASAMSMQRATYADLASQNKAAGLQTTNWGWRQEAGNFQISIEGDLNEQEQADLSNALQQVEKMMRDFVGGNKEKALAGMNEFANMETIAAADVDLAYSIQASAQATASGSDNGSESLLDQLLAALRQTQLPASEIIPPLNELFAKLIGEQAQTGADQGETPLAGIRDGVIDQLLQEQASAPGLISALA